MSELQQKAVRLISELSDNNISFLIEIIQRLMPQESYMLNTQSAKEGTGMHAFKRLDAARLEIQKYLPDDFDPEWELEKTRAERYSGAD